MRLKIFAPLAACALAITLIASAAISKLPVTPTDESVTEANITRVTTRLLENSQFSHHPLDDELAGMFLFLQSDVKDFDGTLPTLAQATRRVGDTHEAQKIFDRSLERIEQRTAYVTNALVPSLAR